MSWSNYGLKILVMTGYLFESLHIATHPPLKPPETCPSLSMTYQPIRVWTHPISLSSTRVAVSVAHARCATRLDVRHACATLMSTRSMFVREGWEKLDDGLGVAASR